MGANDASRHPMTSESCLARGVARLDKGGLPGSSSKGLPGEKRCRGSLARVSRDGTSPMHGGERSPRARLKQIRELPVEGELVPHRDLLGAVAGAHASNDERAPLDREVDAPFLERELERAAPRPDAAVRPGRGAQRETGPRRA